MDGRKRESGAKYKKIREAKEEKEAAVLKKIPKIHSFFSRSSKSIENIAGKIFKFLTLFFFFKCKLYKNNVANGYVHPGTSTATSSTPIEPVDSLVLSSDVSTEPTPSTRSDLEPATPTGTEPAVLSSDELLETDTSVQLTGNTAHTVSNDPAEWIINNSTIDYLLSLKSIEQNLNADFSITKMYDPISNQNRTLSKKVFQRKLQNGSVIERKYLCFSQSKKALFCIPCLLFGSKTSKFDTDGYNDWRNVNRDVNSHENSSEHIESRKVFLTRSKKTGKIDSELQIQIEKEFNYWRNVLKRVIAVIKKLSSRGLAFRGKDEKFGSNKNGNYMMSLELIAEFDPFLATHIATHGNPGRGKTSYLSSTICDEVISLVANKVRNEIIAEVKKSKYFSIIVDSTPDVSHVDQLSFVLRYVPANQSNAVERFLKFLPNVGHKSKDMYDIIIVALAGFGLNLENCRGQAYDNAANMAGCYAGLQALILQSNCMAFFVACAVHSLNLVGGCAVESIFEAATFFDYLEAFYTFLVNSTERWKLLQENLKPGHKIAKRATGTRWSRRYDACSAFADSFKEFMEVLENIEKKESEKPENRRKAAGLRKNLCKFESAFMVIFWTAILERFNKANLSLQRVGLDLKSVLNIYKSLIDFVTELRTDENEMFQKFINDAKEIIDVEGDEDEVFAKGQRQRSRRQTLRSGETRENEIILHGREKLKVNIYFAILDRLITELQSRCSSYKLIFEKFSFLLNICDQSIDTSTEDFIKEATNFQQFYKDDIEEETFPLECIHFRNYIKNAIEEGFDCNSTNLLGFIRDRNLEDLFPNVNIALQLYLTMAVTNCTAERSFSYLKRIKNYLRSNLTEDKLDDFGVLCIEGDFLNSLDYEDVINEFAAMKSRRKL